MLPDGESGESASGDEATNDHDASVISGSRRPLPRGEFAAITERSQELLSGIA